MDAERFVDRQLVRMQLIPERVTFQIKFQILQEVKKSASTVTLRSYQGFNDSQPWFLPTLVFLPISGFQISFKSWNLIEHCFNLMHVRNKIWFWLGLSSKKIVCKNGKCRPDKSTGYTDACKEICGFSSCLDAQDPGVCDLTKFIGETANGQQNLCFNSKSSLMSNWKTPFA